MSRKDYTEVASLLSRLRPSIMDEDKFNQWVEFRNGMAAIFAADNSNFNRLKFEVACNE